MAKTDFWMLHRTRVRFNEADPQGIAHNSIYLVWFGVALGEYYRGLPYDRAGAGERDGTGIHVVRATVEYKAPIPFDAEIDIGARVVRLGRTSVTFVYELFSPEDGRVLGGGEQVWVNTSTETHRPAPWPDDFVAILRAREPALEEAQSTKA